MPGNGHPGRADEPAVFPELGCGRAGAHAGGRAVFRCRGAGGDHASRADARGRAGLGVVAPAVGRAVSGRRRSGRPSHGLRDDHAVDAGSAAKEGLPGAVREPERAGGVHVAGPRHLLSAAPPQGAGDLSRHFRDREVAAGRRAMAHSSARRLAVSRERPGPRHAHRRRAPAHLGRLDRSSGLSAPGAGGGRSGGRRAGVRSRARLDAPIRSRRYQAVRQSGYRGGKSRRDCREPKRRRCSRGIREPVRDGGTRQEFSNSPSNAAQAACSRSGANRPRRVSPCARTVSRKPGSVSPRWSRAWSASVSPGG